MKLPERIKAIRLNEGLSQKEMANKLGIAVSTYQYYERGQRIPPADFIVKLINTYGVSPDWFLKGVGEMSDSGVKQSLNLDFMKEVIEAIEKVFEQEKASLSYNKKAELVILIYETLLKEEAKFKGKTREKFLRDNVIKFIKLAS
jgi:transcriptional regulator with XRE-family HTH domain